ncbi:MAG TPA: hypothetical protein VL095_15480, partial [Flavisolibacter sp.]|nr:hypothetical protein [Flavisolibacter sp.]
MRRIFTFSFIAIALLLTSFNSFGQCTTPTTENFTNASNTRSFTGARRTGTGTFSTLAPVGNELRSTVTATNSTTYAITSPTYSIPTLAPTINFTFAYGDGPQSTLTGVQYAIRYVNTSNVIVETTPVPYSSGTCVSVPRPGNMKGNSYQVVAIYTFTSGTGNSANSYLSFDTFGTNGTLSNASLPVKFQTFEAMPSNNSVSLKWAVGTEENVSGYEVEKSFDGRNFSKVGFVNAANQSTYTFVDGKSSGTVYYRIKSIDIDGRYGFSTIAFVKAGQSLIMLNAYPSPFVNSFNLDHGTATAGSLISISAEDGRIIKTIV